MFQQAIAEIYSKGVILDKWPAGHYVNILHSKTFESFATEEYLNLNVVLHFHHYKKHISVSA